MPRTEQVSGYVYRQSPEEGGIEYLALRRSQERGGFWQGVSGGIEPTDKTRRDAMVRELGEELQLEPLQITESDTTYSFIGDEGNELTEWTFGVEVPADAEPRLSDEHNAYLWVPERTMDDLIPRKWTDNKLALAALARTLRTERGLTSIEHGLSADNYSVLVLKPDAKARELDDEVFARVQAKGLGFAAARRQVQLDDDMIEELWIPPTKWDENPMEELDDWWYALVDYMKSAPVDAFLVEGQDASQELLKMKRMLRTKYDSDFLEADDRPVSERVRSLLHGSDSDRELVRNALAFWSDAEIRDAVKKRKLAGNGNN